MSQHATSSRDTCRGFTLIEVVVSSAILALVLLSASSALVLVSRTVDDGSHRDVNIRVPQAAANEILSDLAIATAISEQTPTAITLSVPDRDGDGNVEKIRYAWNGTPGSPLTRQVNNGIVVTMVEHVAEFDLSYLTRTVGPPPPPPLPVEIASDEQVLVFHDDNPGGSMYTGQLSTSLWAAAYVKPDLPDNAVRWKITRVRLMMRRGAAPTTDVVVEIRPANAALQPGITVIDSRKHDDKHLPQTLQWVEFAFSDADGLEPTDGYYVVVRPSGSGSFPYLQLEAGMTPGTPQTHVVGGNDTGWSAASEDYDLRIYVHGTYTTEHSGL